MTLTGGPGEDLVIRHRAMVARRRGMGSLTEFTEWWAVGRELLVARGAQAILDEMWGDWDPDTIGERHVRNAFRMSRAIVDALEIEPIDQEQHDVANPWFSIAVLKPREDAQP